MKSIPLVVALAAIGAALTACTPERTFDGALGATSGLIVAGPVGLVAGGVVGATAGTGDRFKLGHSRRPPLPAPPAPWLLSRRRKGGGLGRGAMSAFGMALSAPPPPKM